MSLFLVQVLVLVLILRLVLVLVLGLAVPHTVYFDKLRTTFMTLIPISFNKSCTPDELVDSNTCLDALAMYSVLASRTCQESVRHLGSSENRKQEDVKTERTPRKLLKETRSDGERSLMELITLLKSPRRTNRSTE